VAALAADADPALVERGHYLAVAGDCGACHSAPGDKPMAGGLAVGTPIGAIISTNITPSKIAGIGTYTLAQFAAALRRGVRADGARLYPAMPYTAYAGVTDADVKALYSYFMLGVAPVDQRPAEPRLPFPFNIRLSMMAWNLLFLDTKPFTPDPGKSAEWNRGAYLAVTLGHCGTCHTPRNLLMAEEGSRLLAGSDLGTWFAPNITSSANSGIGAWSVGDLVSYMRDGRAAGKGQAAGPMAEAIDHSLRHLSEGDRGLSADRSRGRWCRRYQAAQRMGRARRPVGRDPRGRPAAGPGAVERAATLRRLLRHLPSGGGAGQLRWPPAVAVSQHHAWPATQRKSGDGHPRWCASRAGCEYAGLRP
jgi:mono/diheme cytochrome c family protein